jgi:hypothetical protein
MQQLYEDTCKVTDTDSGKTLDAEILDFKRGYMLTCSVNRQVKIIMRYNNGSKNYTGRVGSMEFTSTGPKEVIRNSR